MTLDFLKFLRSAHWAHARYLPVLQDHGLSRVQMRNIPGAKHVETPRTEENGGWEALVGILLKTQGVSAPVLSLCSHLAPSPPILGGGGCVGVGGLSKEFLRMAIETLREAPFNLSPPLFGHCPNSNYTPPPHSNGHPGALFFRRDFTFLPFLPFFLPFFYHFLWISAPNHPGKGLDPPKIKQMPIWTWKILL